MRRATGDLKGSELVGDSAATPRPLKRGETRHSQYANERMRRAKGDLKGSELVGDSAATPRPLKRGETRHSQYT